MARKPVTDMSAWPSLTLEGNLIAPAMVASIDRRKPPIRRKRIIASARG